MALDFPSIPPTRRSFETGDWPVKTFKAQNGSEARVLYGNRRTGMTLSLEWQNITSNQAESIFNHYNDKQGTYQTFAFGSGGDDVRAGWTGTSSVLGAGATGGAWRYAEAPTIETVSRDVHNVSVKLIAVL